MKIFNCPIEPLEDRYSLDWLLWFDKEFQERDINFETVLPKPLTTKITHGSFLDVAGTNYFKARQIAELSKLFFNSEIKDGDIIFLHDIWFPGLESIAYMRDGLGIDVKIVGCIFAGTYDPYDFLTKKGMGYWGNSLEESWFRILDQIYVATDFHKRLIMEHRDIDPKKLIVTGHPCCLDWNFNEEYKKENIIVFPHRLDSEKNPDLFEKLQIECATDFNFVKDNWQFYQTKLVTKNKKEYYDLLKKAKISVSFADQETYGFAMVESIAAGCLPLVPNRLSYAEMYHPFFTFKSFNEAVRLLINMVSFYENYLPIMERNKDELLTKARQAIPNMIDCMRKL